MIPYLNPRCHPATLDSYTNLRALLSAVERELVAFRGIVLDVGCGEMPYKPLIMKRADRVTRYIGLDLPASGFAPDVLWDGRTIPIGTGTVDTVLLTEVLEHCPEPPRVLAEVHRVLKPGGLLYLTVPFIWPFHDVPFDEYRYTPFALQRMMQSVGFAEPRIEATAGRHATLAVMTGLWVRRRPLGSLRRVATRKILSTLLWPIVWWLSRIDTRPVELGESTLVVGLTATARKSA